MDPDLLEAPEGVGNNVKVECRACVLFWYSRKPTVFISALGEPVCQNATDPQKR